MTHRGPFQPLLFCDSVILVVFFSDNFMVSGQDLILEGKRDYEYRIEC